MDIQVGDKITYEDCIEKKTYTMIIDCEAIRMDLLSRMSIKILKIERPNYEVIEEKKELLTEEEKEFLKDINKFFDITNMLFCDNSIGSYKCDEIIFYCDYPKGLKFEGIEKNKHYTLEELGIN